MGKWFRPHERQREREVQSFSKRDWKYRFFSEIYLKLNGRSGITSSNICFPVKISVKVMQHETSMDNNGVQLDSNEKLILIALLRFS